jgi:hypothetical protein
MLIPEISALVTIFIAFSPFFTAIFLVMHSFFKNNLQGILYLSFLIITQIFGYLIRPIIGGVRPDIAALESGDIYFSKHRACNIIEDPWFSKYSSPSFHAIHHSFTLVYIFLYELNEYKVPKRWIMFVIFCLIYVADFIFRIINNCVKVTHYLAGTFFGVFFAVVFYNIVQAINPNLSFDSNTVEPEKCKITGSKMQCKMEVWTFDTETKEYTKEGDNALRNLKWDDWLAAFKNGSINNENAEKMLEPVAHDHEIDQHTHRVSMLGHQHSAIGEAGKTTDTSKTSDGGGASTTKIRGWEHLRDKDALSQEIRERKREDTSMGGRITTALNTINTKANKTEVANHKHNHNHAYLDKSSVTVDGNKIRTSNSAGERPN